MRESLVALSHVLLNTDKLHSSVEHNDVQVVAVNDPFIEPKYAVSTIDGPTLLPPYSRASVDLAAGVHAEVRFNPRPIQWYHRSWL